MGLCATLSGCAGTLSDLPFFDHYDKGRIEGSTEPSKRRISRVQASMQLTDEGRSLLESGRPDDAISVLERSVSLDPTNGKNYYYLSEAWLFKGNLEQAEEFNRLAELYLKDDSFWLVKAAEQRERIDSARK